MMRRICVSIQPKQKPIVRALAIALAVTGSASTAFASHEKTSELVEGNPIPSINEMSPSHRESLFRNWRDLRKSEADKSEAETLILSWRQRHALLNSQSLEKDLALKEIQGVSHTVQNCDDAGAGSLRTTIAAAADGDTVDMSGLTCSTITLTTGAIVINQNDLQIVGPGAGQLAISGENESQVFSHSGSGTLSIDAITVRNGFKYSDKANVTGGCVSSNGSVALTDVEVRDCVALSTYMNGKARGGGVSAVGSISVTGSLISGNTAANKYDGQGGLAAALGGGLYAQNGQVRVTDSLITNNQAYSTDVADITLSALGGGVFSGGGIETKYSQFTQNAAGDGGALAVRGPVTIAHSTISDNDAAGSSAAGFFAGVIANVSHAFSMRNSTVSGNHADACGGMRIESFDQAWISSSTIAHNHSESSACGGGIHVNQVGELRLESAIVADNTVAGDPGDLDGVDVDVVIGANNLVFESSLQLPPDTVTQKSPLLAPLAFNGGLTQTHALTVGSPALDVGNNVFNLTNDQRGEGFLRVFGPQADVGAFESQGDPVPNDRIFYNGFGFGEELGGPGG